MTRAEKVAYAQRRRAAGALLREIAAEMNCAIQTVGTWLSDPDLSKQRTRRDGYRGECVDCGAPTDGSNGPRGAAQRCSEHSLRHQHETRRWTPEALIEEVKRFAEQYGRPPRELDWNPRPSNVVRRRGWVPPDETWPSSALAGREFGSWNGMIAAAGFRPFDHELDHDWGAGKLSPSIERAA
jgi:hypothetical protein